MYQTPLYRPRKKRRRTWPWAVGLIVLLGGAGGWWLLSGRPLLPARSAASTAPLHVASVVATETTAAAEPTATAAATSAETSSAEATAVADTSWHERYSGKLVLGFKPEAGYKAVALTFDDGPNSRTQYIIDTLKRYDGTATFFFSGKLLQRKGAAKQAALVDESGFEVANHTQDHAIGNVSAMWHRSYDFDVAEIAGPDKYIKPQIGHNTLWVRPMGGAIDATGIRAAKDTGHLVINWTVDSNDSHGGPRTPDYIYSQVTDGISSGDVVLLHVTHPESMKALPRICEELTRRGFRLVTLSELAAHSRPITGRIPK